MAVPDHFTGSEILVQIGDGNSPEVFSHPCLINAERGFAINTSMEESVIPDCANPTGLAAVNRDPDSVSWDINGEGVMDAADAEDWITWANTGLKKNVQIVIDSGGDNERTYQGQYVLPTFELRGTRKGKANVTVSLQSDGFVTDVT